MGAVFAGIDEAVHSEHWQFKRASIATLVRNVAVGHSSAILLEGEVGLRTAGFGNVSAPPVVGRIFEALGSLFKF